METILNSWKQIALYMGRGVRTVERWERELGLPVRRPHNHPRSPVIAIPAEIDEWLRNGRSSNRQGNGHLVPRVQLQLVTAQVLSNVKRVRRNMELMRWHVEQLRQARISPDNGNGRQLTANLLVARSNYNGNDT